MWTQIDQLRDTIALAEAQTPITDLNRLAEWDRQPDPALFSIGAKRLISPEVLLNDLQEWIHAANLQSDHVELIGDEPARRVIIKVKGDPAVAIPRAMALSRALRDPSGRWKRFTSSDTQGQPVDIYISSDKSPKQIRTEVQTKKLLDLIQQRHPRLRWRAFRNKGEIHCDNVPGIKIIVRGQNDPSSIQWSEQAINSPTFQHIDRGDILTSFQALFNSDSDTATWRAI